MSHRSSRSSFAKLNLSYVCLKFVESFHSSSRGLVVGDFCYGRLKTSPPAPVQVPRDAHHRDGPVGSETRPALVPEPAVPPVAHRAPGRGEGERTEDPVHLPEGTGDPAFNRGQ